MSLKKAGGDIHCNVLQIQHQVQMCRFSDPRMLGQCRWSMMFLNGDMLACAVVEESVWAANGLKLVVA
jgi:hypothetical protein